MLFKNFIFFSLNPYIEVILQTILTEESHSTMMTEVLFLVELPLYEWMCDIRSRVTGVTRPSFAFQKALSSKPVLSDEQKLSAVLLKECHTCPVNPKHTS